MDVFLRELKKLSDANRLKFESIKSNFCTLDLEAQFKATDDIHRCDGYAKALSDVCKILKENLDGKGGLK